MVVLPFRRCQARGILVKAAEMVVSDSHGELQVGVFWLRTANLFTQIYGLLEPLLCIFSGLDRVAQSQAAIREPALGVHATSNIVWQVLEEIDGPVKVLRGQFWSAQQVLDRGCLLIRRCHVESDGRIGIVELLKGSLIKRQGVLQKLLLQLPQPWHVGQSF